MASKWSSASNALGFPNVMWTTIPFSRYLAYTKCMPYIPIPKYHLHGPQQWALKFLVHERSHLRLDDVQACGFLEQHMLRPCLYCIRRRTIKSDHIVSISGRIQPRALCNRGVVCGLIAMRSVAL